MTAVLSNTVTLVVPLAVLRDGGATTVSTLILKRPNTGQVKRLVALIGADFAKAFLADNGTSMEDFDIAGFAKETLPLLLTLERLDALSALAAEICGILPNEFDNLDVADLGSVLMGVIGFFPKLQSIASASLKLP